MKHNHYKDPWRKCALYEVWCDMMRAGRRMYNQNRKYGTGDDFPVDPIFREYDKFRLWACFCHKYKMGEMDDYHLCRKDRTQGFSPENCYFSKVPQGYFEEESSPVSKGASECLWKSDKPSKGNGKARWGGLSRTRLYNIWKGMCRRCTDPGQKDYPDYGRRGITVCDEWRYDFLKFYEWAWEHGYSPDLSIDRIDVDGNYCPENCRWASYLEQKLNTRAYDGKYENVRCKVSDMRNMLESMPGNVVVTLVVRSCYLPDVMPEKSDYPSVPENERYDVETAR